MTTVALQPMIYVYLEPPESTEPNERKETIMATIRRANLTMVTSAVSRRTALRSLGGAGLATAVGLAAPGGLRASEDTSATMIEPDAGTWKTWLLSSGDQFRPE